MNGESNKEQERKRVSGGACEKEEANEREKGREWGRSRRWQGLNVGTRERKERKLYKN